MVMNEKKVAQVITLVITVYVELRTSQSMIFTSV